MTETINRQARTILALEAEKQRVLAAAAAAHRATRRRMLNDLPDDVIYPQTFGGFPACASCFQRTPDLATTMDLRYGALALLCGPCAHAIATGQPITLPTGDVLAETWERLARWRQNREINDDTIAAAAEQLAPELTPEQAADAVLQLREALLRLQHYRSDMWDPADGDRDYLEGEADRDRTNALAKLMVGDPS